MGLIRGGLLFIVGVLFLGVLIAGGVFYTAQASLEEGSVREELNSVVSDSLKNDYDIDSEVDGRLEEMESFCENNTEFVFNHSESGEVFVIPCEVVSEGKDAIIEHGIEEIVDETYSTQFFLSKTYWKTKFYYALVGSLILLGLLWLFVERKANSLIIAGGLAILGSLPFMALDSFASFFVEKQFVALLASLFLGANSAFIVLLVGGIIFVGVGIGLRFWTFGSTKKKFSKDEVKNIVKKEMKKK